MNRLIQAARIVGGACLLVGCDLTEIDAPGVVQPGSLENAAGAVARYAGATGQFVGASLNNIAAIGIFTDELITGVAAGLASPGQSSYIDARRLPESGGCVVAPGCGYTALHQTRVNLAAASEALRRYAATPQSRIGQMLGYSGFVELLFAENYCAGIPFSSTTNGVVQYGQPTTGTDVYQRALAHFDSALTFSSDSARILNMARVGKGRALLGLARYAEAATAVAAVPTNFVHNLEIASTAAAQQNMLFTSMNSAGGNGVGSGEGTNGLNYRTANDPRVPTVFVARATDNRNDIYRFTRYNSTGAVVPLATGIEARLIESEAALKANNNDTSPTGTGWLGILNTLRATAIAPAMPALADPGSHPARVDLLFRERAFWMYLTGHRLGDLRRLVRLYGRPANAVFPTGTFLKDGLPYGDDVTFPIGTNDAQNPFFVGCTDRAT